MNIMKKIILITMLLLSFLIITNVEANVEAGFVDFKTYTSAYKMSEDSDIKLPFIKFFKEKAIFDKKVDKSGMTVAANAVEITEDINGLQGILSSDSVDIKGSMEYGIIMASNVVISGNIEKDIFILSESVFITETANISGDILIFADKVEMRGSVGGNFISKSKDFLMEGSVGKDFRVSAENITFNETDIKGDIYIETESDLDISDEYENASVKKIQPDSFTKAERKNQIIKLIVKLVTTVILFVLLNIIIRKIKPELFKNLGNKLIAHSCFAVIMGVITLTSIPLVVTLALLCSVFGLGVVTTPIFIVYIAAIIVVISLSKFIVGSIIYELLKEKINVKWKFKDTILLAMIFGLICILCYIPHISWFVTMSIVLISAGSVVTGLLKKQ